MQILITLSYYSPQISGLSNYAKNLAEALVRRGNNVSILTTQHEKHLSENDVINKVKVIRVPYVFRISKGSIMPLYFFYALKLIKDTDSVITNLPQFESIVITILAKILRKKIYCIYHCDIKLSNTKFGKLIEEGINVTNLISMALADKVITNTEDFANNSKILRLFKYKLYFIYPPIKLPEIDLVARKNIKRRIPGNVKFLIAVVSRIAADKGLEYLLESIPILRKKIGEEFLLLIVGPTQVTGEAKYEKKINNLLIKYREYTLYLGTLTSEELGAFYSIIDVLVLPSINSTESFGMVQVEAMFYGVPVVASGLPGVRVPVQKTGMGELVSPGNSKDLAEKVIKVLKHSEKYKKDKKSIEKIFNFENIINEYEKLFKI